MKYLILISVLFSTSAFADGECAKGDALACQADFQKAFKGDDNGVTRVKNWWNGWSNTSEGDFWKLSQVFNGFAVFKYTGTGTKDYRIAVKAKGMKHEVKIGNPLPWFADCIKYGANITAKGEDGMPITIRLYEVAKCTDGKDE